MRAILAIATILLAAATANPQDAEPMATAVRGIAGTIEFEVAGERITARPVQSATAPLVVRILDSQTGDDGLTRYRAAFIGTIAGDYDLSTLLQRHDGAPAATGPIPVRVISQLPADHGTDLYTRSEGQMLTAGRYRAAMIALGALWLAAPLLYFAVRAALRRPEPPAAPPPPAPTLADQLRPLVESAMAGSLSIQGRGQLELMLYMHWRQRLGLDGPQAQAVARLRRDAQAGELLRAVEAWLHARPDEAPADGDVAALLAPYRDAPAIGDVETAPAAHPPHAAHASGGPR